MSTTDAPPATAVEPAPPTPTVIPPPVDQPVTTPAEQRNTRTQRRRGMPVAPLVIAAGNGTTMTATAAYQAAGPAGLVGTAAVFGAVSVAAIVRRRGTVKARRSATLAGRSRSTLPNRGRSGSGALRSGSGTGTHSGAGAGSGRFGASKRQRSGAGTGSGLRSTLGAGASTRSRSLPLGGGTLSPKGSGSAKRTPKRARNGGAASRAGSTLRSRRPLVRSALGAASRGAAKTGRGLAAAGRGLKSTGRALGRGVARPAAATTRLARAAAKRTEGARRAAGRGARAAWDGLLSGVAGLASALWNKSPRSGLATLRAVWSKRRRTRAAKAAAKGPAMTGPAAALTPPPIATYVRRPAFAGGTATTIGAARMPGGHHFLGPAMEMHRIAATYKPEGMMQVGRDFAGLAEALEHIANAMRVTTARADAEQPLDPRIVEMMQQIYGLQIKAAELAKQLKPAFASCHRVDVDRLQNQRRGEHEWDVTRNADVSL